VAPHGRRLAERRRADTEVHIELIVPWESAMQVGRSRRLTKLVQQRLDEATGER
jgi:hypothetical protein